ncbi:MAG: hypothetical protein ACM37W_26775 [Actinomycetota bacterium]
MLTVQVVRRTRHPEVFEIVDSLRIFVIKLEVSRIRENSPIFPLEIKESSVSQKLLQYHDS